MVNKKALIITGKMVQDHEYIYPLYRLKEDDYLVDIATTDGLETQGQIGVKVIPNKLTSELSVNDYDLLILPGGAKCMEYLRQDRSTINFISAFHATGKVIGSICHAAQLLISAKIVKGKKIAGYYSLKDDIENAGAIYEDRPAVIDGNIVSTAHYKDIGHWMKAVIASSNIVKSKV
jgi:protease I